MLDKNVNIESNPLNSIENLEGDFEEFGFRTVLNRLVDSLNKSRIENGQTVSVGNFIFTGAPGNL